MKYFLIALAMATVAGLSSPVQARQECELVCTKTERKCIKSPKHYCWDECKHYKWQCITPVVPTPTVEPTPTIESTATPSATPVPQFFPVLDDGKAGVPALPGCPTFWPVGPSVTHYERFNNGTSLRLWWNKVDQFVRSYVVSYGPASNLLVWNTIVIGSEYTEIHMLPPKMSIFVGVQQLHDGCVSNFGSIIDP